jgi:hypothetical protein
MRRRRDAKRAVEQTLSLPAVALGLTALAVGGCAEVRHVTSLTPPAVNPSSPIAQYGEAVSRETFAKPSFRNVPPKPINVPTAAAYKLTVMREVQLRRDLAAWRATHPQLTSDTEAWADMERKRIPQMSSAPVSATHDAESEAFAKRLREEAGKPQPQP